MPYLDAFEHKGLTQFIHEAKMVGKLIQEIKTRIPVRDRWLPNFIVSLKNIEDVLNSPRYYHEKAFTHLGGTRLKRTPETLGQYIIAAMCERMRRRIARGLSLRVLIYALALITRHALDNNIEKLSALLTSEGKELVMIVS